MQLKLLNVICLFLGLTIASPNIDIKSQVINPTLTNVIINGQTNNLLINILNNDLKNYTLDYINGKFLNVNNDKLIKATPIVKGIDKLLPVNETVSYPYAFPSEYKPGEIKLDLEVGVKDIDEGEIHKYNAFDGVLTVIEPSFSLDFQTISIYILLAGLAYFLTKYLYESYFLNGQSSNKKKNKKRDIKPSEPVTSVNLENVPSNAFDNEWVPQLAKLKPRRGEKQRSSNDESSNDEKSKKSNKKSNKSQGRRK